MAVFDILEGSQISPKVEAVYGKWEFFKTQTAEFSFTILPPQGMDLSKVQGLRIDKNTVAIEGNAARHTVRAPLVPDDIPYYRLLVTVFVPSLDKLEKKLDHGTIYHVWPAHIDVKLKPVDEAGSDAPMAAITFTTTQPGQPAVERTTDPTTGELRINFKYPGEVEVKLAKPYVLASWTKGDAKTGRKREAKVKNPYEVQFLEPASGKHEWVVNRPTSNGGKDKRGQKIEIVVCGKGDDVAQENAKVAKPNDYVFVTCTFSAKTARTDVGWKLEGVEGHSSKDSGKVQTGKVKIGNDKKAKFKVDLGFAGGETCKIEIGTTPSITSDTMEIETWREIDYELLLPLADGGDRLTDYTILKTATDAGLSGTTVGTLKAALDEVFLRFTEKRAAFYDKSKLPDGGKGNLFDAAEFKKDSGKKVCVVSIHDKDTVMSNIMTEVNKHTMSILVCDYLAMPHQWDQLLEKVSADGDRALPEKRFVVSKAVDGTVLSIARGDFVIKKLRWKATHYKEEWSLDPEKEILQDTDPGGAHRNWQDIDDATDIAKHIVPAFDKISLKFPADKNIFPGHAFVLDDFLGLSVTKDTKKYTIFLSIQIQGVFLQLPLGSALQGNVNACTHAGLVVPNVLARTIAHELGHNMGQGYGGKGKGGTTEEKDDFNLRGRTSPMPGIPFPLTVDAGGDIYVKRGHQGIHCAFGVTKKNEASYSYGGVYNEATCIMFGAGLSDDATAYKFCANCKTYILAEDIRDIRRDWRV